MIGQEHPRYSHSMAMLALTYCEQKTYTEAKTLLVEAGEISKRVLGETNAETLRCLEGLAGMYEVQGRFHEAEKLCTTVLNAKRANLGDENWDTVGTRANIPSLYTDQGRLEEVDEERVRTLEIRQKVLGRDHLVALLDLHDLAIIRMRRDTRLLRLFYLEHRSCGALQPIPMRSITSLSRCSQVSPPCSRSTTWPLESRARTPLESNFQECAFFACRRRSRWKVVSPDQPSTAQPTVRHGDIMISTRR